MRARGRLAASVVSVAVLAAACGGEPSPSVRASAPTTTARPVATTATVAPTTVLRPAAATVRLSPGADPETHAPGIDIAYAWDPKLDSSGGALVQLYQNDRLVGQIPYLPGWEGEVPAFFRTSATPAANAFYAVGRLFDRNHKEVSGSRAQSATVRWNVTVQPGQVVAASAGPSGRSGVG